MPCCSSTMHVKHCVLCPWKLASWPVIKARWPEFTNHHRKSLASTKYPCETSVASSVSALDSWDSLTPAASSWLPIWEGTLKRECWLVPSALQLSGHALSLHPCKRMRVSLLSEWSDACWDEKPNSFQMSSIYLCHQHSWNAPELSPCVWACSVCLTLLPSPVFLSGKPYTSKEKWDTTLCNILLEDVQWVAFFIVFHLLRTRYESRSWIRSRFRKSHPQNVATQAVMRSLLLTPALLSTFSLRLMLLTLVAAATHMALDAIHSLPLTGQAGQATSKSLF